MERFVNDFSCTSHAMIYKNGANFSSAESKYRWSNFKKQAYLVNRRDEE